MKQNEQIERLFKSRQYREALAALDDRLKSRKPSVWSSTTKLRCMRALRHKDAVSYADQLCSMIEQRSEPFPMNTSQRNNLLRYIALVYSERNRASDACRIMAELCKQSPNAAPLYREYAFALANDSRSDEAESTLNRAIELQPEHVGAHAQLGHIYCRTGRVDAGCNSFSRAATLEPDDVSYLQRLLFWSNYSERATERSIHQLTKLWANRMFPNCQSSTFKAHSFDPNRPLKLGFVSADLHAHSVSFFVIPLLEGLNRSEFQLTVYSDTKRPDHVSDSIRALADVWLDSSAMKDAQLAERISTDQVDILIDMNGHTRWNRLGVFAEQLAPIQLSWLGYPSTTGLNTIGHRISDRIADPVGLGNQLYSERLLRLPNGLLCYKPPKNAPEIKPRGDHDRIRFGAFSDLAKVSNLALDCWAAALLAVPRSTITIKHHHLASENASAYLLKELAVRGIPESRVKLDSSKTKIQQHLDQYNEIDIALDTTPYNSPNSALAALWMGVPVISLAGGTHASRLTASILHRINLDDLATKTVFEYANRAKELAESPETLSELRFGLRKRMTESPLTNNKQFASEFGNAIRSQWRAWCREHSPKPSNPSAEAKK